MQRLKKGDIVKVTSGKDKGKTAKILRVYADLGKAIVEGINFSKKHLRRTKDNPKGGIIEKENPIHLSNLMLFCKACNRPVRVKMSELKDNTKSRACVRCNATI
jgi:large subunit ribosomal protein L24